MQAVGKKRIGTAATNAKIPHGEMHGILGRA